MDIEVGLRAETFARANEMRVVIRLLFARSEYNRADISSSYRDQAPIVVLFLNLT